MDEGWERVANTIGSCIEVPLIKCELFETLHIYRGTILNPEPSANETLYKIIGLNTSPAFVISLLDLLEKHECFLLTTLNLAYLKAYCGILSNESLGTDLFGD